MARNQTVDTTEERIHFVLELLRQDPEVKSSDVQEKVKSKFGSPVSTRVLNQLRDQVQAEAEESASEPLFEPEPVKAIELPAEMPMSGSPAQKASRPAKGAKVKHVFIEAQKEQLDFLERVVAQLQEAGVANLRIDHGTDRWVVFAVEGK